MVRSPAATSEGFPTMTTKTAPDTHGTSPPSALSPTRTADGKTPPGYRVLHVIVPERTFNHARAQACLSGMRFADYIARFLEEAFPFPAARSPAPPA